MSAAPRAFETIGRRSVGFFDVVGYGADPEWAVDTVMGLVDDGAIAVIGNHDHAINSSTSWS